MFLLFTPNQESCKKKHLNDPSAKPQTDRQTDRQTKGSSDEMMMRARSLEMPEIKEVSVFVRVGVDNPNRP